MTSSQDVRSYHIRNSEKCYRFKPEAIVNHAPHNKGIYELVTFDDNQNPTVLYVGAAFEKTMNECLEGHLNGTLQPIAHDLFGRYPNLYFDFIAEMNAKSLDDAKDIYWWLVNKYKPEYNDLAATSHSGRDGEITVDECDV
jgi:hypothetical protein